MGGVTPRRFSYSPEEQGYDEVTPSLLPHLPQSTQTCTQIIVLKPSPEKSHKTGWLPAMAGAVGNSVAASRLLY